MNTYFYKTRPAWRNWWFSITGVFSCFLIGILISLSFNDIRELAVFLGNNIPFAKHLLISWVKTLKHSGSYFNHLNYIEWRDTVSYTFYLAGLILSAKVLYHRYSRMYVLTNQIAESHKGIIAREIDTTKLSPEVNIELRQSFFQRIFLLGDITFIAVSNDDDDIVFKGVSSAMKIKRDAQELQGQNMGLR